MGSGRKTALAQICHAEAEVKRYNKKQAIKVKAPGGHNGNQATQPLSRSGSGSRPGHVLRARPALAAPLLGNSLPAVRLTGRSAAYGQNLCALLPAPPAGARSEEHTSELQSR